MIFWNIIDAPDQHLSGLNSEPARQYNDMYRCIHARHCKLHARGEPQLSGEIFLRKSDVGLNNGLFNQLVLRWETDKHWKIYELVLRRIFFRIFLSTVWAIDAKPTLIMATDVRFHCEDSGWNFHDQLAILQFLGYNFPICFSFFCTFRGGISMVIMNARMSFDGILLFYLFVMNYFVIMRLLYNSGQYHESIVQPLIYSHMRSINWIQCGQEWNPKCFVIKLSPSRQPISSERVDRINNNIKRHNMNAIIENCCEEEEEADESWRSRWNNLDRNIITRFMSRMLPHKTRLERRIWDLAARQKSKLSVFCLANLRDCYPLYTPMDLSRPRPSKCILISNDPKLFYRIIFTRGRPPDRNWWLQALSLHLSLSLFIMSILIRRFPEELLNRIPCLPSLLRTISARRALYEFDISQCCIIRASNIRFGISPE